MEKIRRQKPIKKFYRLNENIRAQELRVIDPEGNQLGVITKDLALEKAKELELDLVEIAPNIEPPVAKIIDFKKFLYLEERKQKEARKKTKETELKEVRVSPFIGDHDLDVALKKVKNFLNDGDLVKISIVFKGRQMAHTEFGPRLLERILGLLSQIGEQDREPRWEGRRYVSTVKPTKETIQKAHQEEKQKERQREKEKQDQKEETKNETEN